jgi:Protein of unknown function (DUF3592)
MAMELCVNDKFTTDPSAEDIGRALDSGPHATDWYLVLDDEADDSNIEATARSDGTYDVTAGDGDHEGLASGPLTGDQVKAILLQYRSRDSGWRDHFTWESQAQDEEEGEETRPSAKRWSEPPTWAVVIVVASIALVVIAGLARSWLPFGDSDYFFVGLIFLPMLVLVVVAVLAKMLEVRQAASWATAVGRIVTAGTQAQHHKFADEATTVRSLPVVEYEFAVGGRKVRGSRISVGEDSGGANTEATLRRYTVGAAVTVYYDPANPNNCVLERGVPQGVGKGLAILAGLVVVLAGAVYWLATSAPGLVERHFPGANAPVVIIAASLGVLVLLFFIASRRMSRRAADWPLVRGTVIRSAIERVQTRDSGGTAVHHTPVVEYGYRVNDVDYVSRQIKLGMTLSGSESYAAGVAARYPEGSAIDVHYDPANPSNAALENPTSMHWLLLAASAALFALAVHQAGAFP